MSYDDGANWEDLRLNMPDVPVSDLIVTDNELAISTHGRGFWILDNVIPLRQASPAVLAADAYLYAPPPAIRSGPAAAFTYKLTTVPKRIELAILDSAGGVMRSFIPDTTPPGGCARCSSRWRTSWWCSRAVAKEHRIQSLHLGFAHAVHRKFSGHDFVGRRHERARCAARSNTRCAWSSMEKRWTAPLVVKRNPLIT